MSEGYMSGGFLSGGFVLEPSKEDLADLGYITL